VNVLGINAYHGDAAACLFSDGRLIAAAEEERFRRVRHWAGLPAHAVRYCLKEGGLTLRDIEHIAINRNPHANILKKALFVLRHQPTWAAMRSRLRNSTSVQGVARALAAEFSSPLRATVHHIEHHRAHLASSFSVSPFDAAAVASVDGFGDFVSTMVGDAEGGRIRILDRVSFPHSLGLFYLAMTQHLGFFGYGDEYKVMGLAAYGEPEYLDRLRKIVQLRNRGRFELSLEYFLHHADGITLSWEDAAPTVSRVFSEAFVNLLGPPRHPDEPVTARHRNLAASLQAVYEETFFHILNHLQARTNRRSLCLAGGCALNSVANGKIFARTPFDAVYIPPAPGDAGGAIGAAVAVWHQILGRSRDFVMDRHDWGPAYSAAAIQDELDKRDHELAARRCRVDRFDDEPARCRRVAEAIARGEVVGWFQGRMEWGARALGQRSILADARRPEMKDTLNARIKRREAFRPFAPSILEEAVGTYFEETRPSPFMTMTYRVRPDKRAVIPASTHVDGSGRLQTVSGKRQPLYWGLIKAFENLTGVPVVLNTSFNENEPIVCTPGEALDCFLRTRMDSLAIGPFVLSQSSPAGERT
jgi:carbamoyltransferase